MSKITIKFNNGNLAILCHKCRAIVKNGSEFTKKELEAAKGQRSLAAYYCKNHT